MKPDTNATPIMEKPLPGPMPRTIWVEHRIEELKGAIDRHPVGHPSAMPWIEEMTEHWKWCTAKGPNKRPRQRRSADTVIGSVATPSSSMDAVHRKS